MLEHLGPNSALLLAAAGLCLIWAEFCLPGFVWPGVTGGVCLVCGVYRLVALGSHAGVLFGCLLLLVGIGVSGWGWLPAWVGALAVVAFAPLLGRLDAGPLHWAVAPVATLPAAALFGLLRVAAWAAYNKTIP